MVIINSEAMIKKDVDCKAMITLIAMIMMIKNEIRDLKSDLRAW